MDGKGLYNQSMNVGYYPTVTNVEVSSSSSSSSSSRYPSSSVPTGKCVNEFVSSFVSSFVRFRTRWRGSAVFFLFISNFFINPSILYHH